MVSPLRKVTVPPDASAANEMGPVPPPVVAPLMSVHPLMVIVPELTLPETVVHTLLPLGPLADAGPLVSAADSAEAGMASAAANRTMRLVRVPPLLVVRGPPLEDPRSLPFGTVLAATCRNGATSVLLLKRSCRRPRYGGRPSPPC